MGRERFGASSAVAWRVLTCKVMFFMGFILVAGLFSEPVAAQIFGGNRQNAQTQLQIDQMQQQIRQLTGQVEQLTFQLQTMQEQMRRFQEDAEFRFQALEGTGVPGQRGSLTPPASGTFDTGGFGTDNTGGFNAGDAGNLDLGLPADGDQNFGTPSQTLGELPAPGQGQRAAPTDGPIDLRSLATGATDPLTGLPVPVPQGATIPLDDDLADEEELVQLEAPADLEGQVVPTSLGGLEDPTALYNTAYSALLRGDYAGAERDFSIFLDTFPDHRLAENARYWLGESYFARGQYADAAEAYLEAYKRGPQNAKAPASLLKLARAMDELGERAVACATLKDVMAKYPDDRYGAAANAELERQRLQCS